MTLTCIIPFFNERDRILKVLDAAVKIKGINEIICADDGSTDGTTDIIKQRYPQVVIIQNKKNLGKTEAVEMTLQRAKGTHILLLDADLQNLQYKEVERAVSTIKKNKKIDMVILRRVNPPFGLKIPFYDVLLCGQRILKKADLLQTLSIYHPKGYQLELALNQYMVVRHKKVRIMPFSFVNTGSTKKMGISRGIYKNIQMPIRLVFGYIGLTNTIKQLLFFYGEENHAELPSGTVN